MINQQFKIGRIVKIEGLNILFEIVRDEEISKIILSWNIKDFVVSIHKYVFAYLPNNKRIVARISEIYDRDLFKKEDIYVKASTKYLAEAKLTAIYDDFTQKLENGINTFPIIGTDVFALPNEIYRKFVSVNSNYYLEIGSSFLDSSISITANPDILFGKHLGIFGNTGTGKSCTVASLVQGLKRRLRDAENKRAAVMPKIIIFDANNEYANAFAQETGGVKEFKVKYISKDNLRLPHTHLSISEYVKFFGASQGVQAPVLKQAINELRAKNPNFAIQDLPNKIVSIIDKKSEDKEGKKNNFSYSQWYGWNSTLLNRIEQIIEDDDIISIIDTDSNVIDSVIEGDDEIILIQADFDRKDLDIIMFLFSKLVYKKSLEKKKNILLVFEEAHRYMNEDDTEDYKLGNFYIERLAREGRKFGISLIISSQRPSELSKTVLSQCNSYIVHKITNRNDLEFISKTLSSNNADILKVISGLEKQYAVVIGEAFAYSDIVKIETANPKTDSDDPSVVKNWLIGEAKNSGKHLKRRRK
jgi:hypothetical protein